jgi:DNA-binding transcriptional LysR family regulator
MINISLRHLRCFVAVAETGSFTLAAARLFHTQSSLTATIQQFEEAIGFRLFDRTTRKVLLTEEALRFKNEAVRLIREFDSSIEDLRAIAKSQRGHIRIAAAPSVIEHILAPALIAFRDSYPNVTISVRDAGADKVERVVLDGEVDFGITSKLNDYSELDYVPILVDRFGVVFLADHPLACIGHLPKWSDLGSHKYVALATDTGIGAFLQAHPDLSLLEKNPHDDASSTTTLHAVLILGGKFSVLPALAAKTGKLKEFEFRELCEPTITREICLITRRLRSFSPNTQRIVDMILATIKEADFAEGVSKIHRDEPH